MKTLLVAAIVVLGSVLGCADDADAQCYNGNCQVPTLAPTIVPPVIMSGPTTETATYTGTQTGTCNSRQRIGNRAFIQVGLINILQGQHSTQGSGQSASVGKQRNRNRIFFRRRR